VELLAEQVAYFYTRMDLMQEHFQGKADQAEERLAQVEAGVSGLGTALEATRHELAVEGLRTEAVGLLLVTAGALVQAGAALFISG
jgi:hypothetical protein